MLKILLIFIFLYAGWIKNLRCEQIPEPTYPDVGKPCPSFTLRNIRYFKLNKATLQDFRGKWLVLDFWNKYCGACVSSFPRVSALQKRFVDNVQFMMVGIQDAEREIEPMFRRLHEEENLAMPCGFDSLLAQRFDIYAAPYIIVIDPAGIVQAITYSLNTEDIIGFLEGRPPRLQKAYRMHEDEAPKTFFDHQRPFLINGNGGPDSVFLFRSLLSVWDGFTQVWDIPKTIERDSAKGMFQVVGVPLIRLFHFAYSGKSWPDSDYAMEPILEVRDSSLFQWSTVHSENLFCYSLQIATNKAGRQSLQQKLRRDLEDYFGYTAAVEMRHFPCWRLIATPEARRRLASRGGKEVFEKIIFKADFKARNWPFRNFVRLLQAHCKEKIIDETAIRGNIDIKIESALSDIEAIRAAIQPWGLDLEPAQESHRVLVIRDSP